MEENPFRHVRLPKVPKRDIHVFSDEECIRMINTAIESQIGAPFQWDLFILTALCTGMRRGELLNTTWQDIDFAKQIIHIRFKDYTEYTWKWQIKDKEGWGNFLRHLKQRGLQGIRLFVTDKCLGLVESLAECYPDADWQRCTVHGYESLV